MVEYVLFDGEMSLLYFESCGSKFIEQLIGGATILGVSQHYQR
jgi:hypothetical protein